MTAEAHKRDLASLMDAAQRDADAALRDYTARMDAIVTRTNAAMRQSAQVNGQRVLERYIRAPEVSGGLRKFYYG